MLNTMQPVKLLLIYKRKTHRLRLNLNRGRKIENKLGQKLHINGAQWSEEEPHTSAAPGKGGFSLLLDKKLNNKFLIEEELS